MSDIVTAMKIADASKEGMTDLKVMLAAAEIYKAAMNNPTDEEMQHLIFKYSALLTASVSTHVTSVLMTESQFNNMVAEVEMFDEIERNVLGE